MREVLSNVDEAFLCVAFVQEKGIHLLGKELDALRRRQVRSRLLVTTTFQTTSRRHSRWRAGSASTSAS